MKRKLFGWMLLVMAGSFIAVPMVCVMTLWAGWPGGLYTTLGIVGTALLMAFMISKGIDLIA